MKPQNERPLMRTTASDKTKYHIGDLKQFAGLRKDINELIFLVRKLCEQTDKNNRGRL